VPARPRSLPQASARARAGAGTVVEARTDEREKLTQLMDLRLRSASNGRWSRRLNRCRPSCVSRLSASGHSLRFSRCFAGEELGCPGQALPTATFEVIGIRSEPSAVACGASRSATSSETACWE
jgi:hypothetical protein